ncbi:anion exchange protein, partial [Necator americanus]
KLYPVVPDLPIPIRFLFVLVSPKENYDRELLGVGRTIGSLLSDEIFRKVALHTLEPYTIVDATDEFLSQIVAVPPGICSTDTRWEPRETETKVRTRVSSLIYSTYSSFSIRFLSGLPDQRQERIEDKDFGQTRSVGMLYATYRDNEDDESRGREEGIVRTGKLFGGLCQDLRVKMPWYLSDFTDFFSGRLSQSLAATIFLFFANITSIITFGAVMERILHHQMASVEAILSGGISGMIFALFAGQPLNILSATGPTLVFENILFEFCIGNGWEFLPFRCWVGIWIAVFLVVLTATDMSALVGLISRFTEEAFATLISIVFIIQAFQKLMEISHDAPIVADPREVYESPCFCHINNFDEKVNATITMRLKDISAEECEERGGEAVGLQCHFKPDVYMLSVLLTFGTFALAYGLNRFRNSKFFTSTFRNTLSDFGVVIAITVMTVFSHMVGLDVPSLHVPRHFKPTLDRPWVVDISQIPPLVAAISFIPAAFYTILIVMDQQITAVIINRKDNMLRKGEGYHLDLLVIAILVLICSFLGLPFYVAATVLSVMHTNSLRVYSDSSAPGEIPRFLGVKEQRLTGFFAHCLIGLAVFLTGVIKLVPLPVLIGIFLYMGVVSLLGQQFVQRIALLFTSVKNQPDYTWLRCVRMHRVHLFTIVQLLSICGLFLVKYTKTISMMFPLMLVVMVIMRMFVLEKIFTQLELSSLDDLLPSFKEVIKPSSKSVFFQTKSSGDGRSPNKDVKNCCNNCIDVISCSCEHFYPICTTRAISSTK